MGTMIPQRSFAAASVAPHSVDELKMQTTAAIWKLRKLKGLSPAPTRLFDTAGKYAHAIYGASKSEGATEAVEKDLNGLSGLMKSNPTFYGFIASPIVAKSRKAEAVKELYKQNQYHPVTQRFIDLVIENGRGSKLPAIVDSLALLLKAERKEVDVKIVTASAPTKESLAETQEILAHVLKERYGADASMNLTTEVDASLKGGMTVNVGEFFMDLSLATKERKFKEYMLADLAKIPSMYPATTPPKPAGYSSDQLAKEIVEAGKRGDLFALHQRLAK
jgi:ATP synthase F1 delta subunit